MIDYKRIIADKEKCKALLQKKGFELDLDEFQRLMDNLACARVKCEEQQAKRNKGAEQIAQLIKDKSANTSKINEVKCDMSECGAKVKELECSLRECELAFRDFMLKIPNIPDEDLLGGGKENNEVINVFGKKTEFDFEPKNHMELSEKLKLIDYERGAKLAGNGCWVYTGVGARLEWALLNFFIEEHVNDGYQFMLVPHMLNYECGLGAGQFPKFEDEVYWIDNKGEGNKFLLPTAETALVSLYRDEILNQDDLPRKFAGYSPCYRREAGSYRSEERGMVRGHQFNKVEMVQYTTKEDSDKAFLELVAKAERLLQKLGLHYQLSKLAAGDCSASMCRTYDIEVWIPSMGIYKEASSASNARDYQARRANMRYRDKITGKTEFMHTLNASGLATSRVFPAILEQLQNKDGSVTIPLVLRKYLGGASLIDCNGKLV